MFKINYYHLFFLAVLSLNSSNLLHLSSSQWNNSSLPPAVNLNNRRFTQHQDSNFAPSYIRTYTPYTYDIQPEANDSTAIAQSEQNVFPSPQHPESSVSIPSLFPVSSSVTPEPYQWHFNNSTNTFVPPFTLSEWDTNNSTDIFNTNFFLPLSHDNENFNNVFTNNTPPLFIPNDSILSNGTKIPVHTNSNAPLSVATKLITNNAPNKPYTCHKCHRKTHSRPKPYTCRYCNATFAFKSKYRYHIKYEEEPNEDRKCHICKKAYSNKYNLTEHNKRVHPSIDS